MFWSMVSFWYLNFEEVIANDLAVEHKTFIWPETMGGFFTLFAYVFWCEIKI